ncbi:unnamed protein product [Allacma fusca]|uniref:Phosphoinositide phospholipase C n=1 Tax=Allacma fusca TaxID=39272 RepID=A0A8J2P5I7_9HEXA|nr:unnamed protein product [Allacma fusca]
MSNVTPPYMSSPLDIDDHLDISPSKSFRIDNMVKHCRVRDDGRLLLVSTQHFEDITEVVNYYKNRPFFKGITLNFPVTKTVFEDLKSIELGSGIGSETPMDGGEVAGYIYTANTNEIKAKALHPYRANRPDILSFEKNDIITNIVKEEENGWWKGDLGCQKQKSFPSHFVEVIEQTNHSNLFGDMQTGTVGLGRVEILSNPDYPRLPYILQIYESVVPFRVAVETSREARDWEDTINDLVHQTGDNRAANPSSLWRSILKMLCKRGRKNKTPKEFSRLIVYCISVPRRPPTDVVSAGRKFNEISSFNEGSAMKLMGSDPVYFCWFHEVQLSRVYPNGQRINSTNYNPITMWNAGCQLVALNYQTPDKAMQLNQGKFRDNGSCGYVLKPEFMFTKDFDPNNVKLLNKLNIQRINLTLTVIAARNLTKPGNKAVIGPFVELEIIGADFDCLKQRTRQNAEFGLSPVWNEKFSFSVLNPDLALIRFSVQDEDTLDDSELIGQATYPVRCLRPGYRSVPLNNGFGEEQLSVLLVHLHPVVASSYSLEPRNTEILPPKFKFMEWQVPQMPEIATAFLVAGNILVLIFAFCGNSAAIIVCLRSKFPRPTTKFYLISLATSDFVHAGLVTVTALGSLTDKYHSWVLGEFMCTITDFMQQWTLLTNCSCLIAIAIDRYWAVVRGLKPPCLPPWITKFLSYVAMACIWLIPIGLSGHLLTYYKREPYWVYVYDGEEWVSDNATYYLCYKPNYNKTADMIYYIVLGSFFTALLAVFLFSYISILVFVRKNFRHVPGEPCPASAGGSEQGTRKITGASFPKRRNRRTAHVLAVLISIFLITRLPLWVFNLMIFIDQKTFGNSVNNTAQGKTNFGCCGRSDSFHHLSVKRLWGKFRRKTPTSYDFTGQSRITPVSTCTQKYYTSDKNETGIKTTTVDPSFFRTGDSDF